MVCVLTRTSPKDNGTATAATHRWRTSPYALNTSISFSSLTVAGRPPTKMDRTFRHVQQHRDEPSGTGQHDVWSWAGTRHNQWIASTRAPAQHTWLVSSVRLGSAQVALTGRPPILPGQSAAAQRRAVRVLCSTAVGASLVDKLQRNDDCQLGTLQELLHWGCGHARWQRQSGRYARALRGLKLLACVIGAGVVVEGHKGKAAVDCGVVLVHHQLHQLHACRTRQECGTQVCASQKPPAKQACCACTRCT